MLPVIFPIHADSLLSLPDTLRELPRLSALMTFVRLFVMSCFPSGRVSTFVVVATYCPNTGLLYATGLPFSKVMTV